ncbi:hypothetical protein [Kurthia sibirica]|uniref:Uncharacterized protein n=1 Tax=Kurthia sibirica TaxID=202750 RepID=A0A2U3AJJ7_9BACL|nr:hypothetical protein [Kurthia sibirica]PWI24690.1 hypothetical protein DEX24_12035 [Kurthia sibirica]GEK34532.1 hypothetical protein KSI01_20650 [Kurthia sibirica]
MLNYSKKNTDLLSVYVEVNENEKIYSSESAELLELTSKAYEDLYYESDKDETNSGIEEDDQPLITPRDSFCPWLVFVLTTNTSYDISCTTSSCSLGHGVMYSKSIEVAHSIATNSEKALIKSALNIRYINSFIFHLTSILKRLCRNRWSFYCDLPLTPTILKKLSLLFKKFSTYV